MSAGWRANQGEREGRKRGAGATGQGKGEMCLGQGGRRRAGSRGEAGARR